MNDGKCDPAGRFWAGSMALDQRRGAGALYRLDPDGRVQTILSDVSISNGLDWSDDGRLMYYVDTPTRSIDVFDFDMAAGAIANRRSLARIPDGEGWPDGLTLEQLVFFQVLDEFSVVFALEIVAGEPAILYQRLDAETAH